ncbi:MAG: hypothetical protein IIA83_00765, partial [Thaumarchaeota archaeon]|nr:hypothetical protein [Nitrososphaerota archaeon]
FNAKHRSPPIDYVGLWDSSCFSPLVDIDNDTKIPFYQMSENPDSDIDYTEELIYSFEELLLIKNHSSVISNRKYDMSLLKFKTSRYCRRLEEFI